MALFGSPDVSQLFSKKDIKGLIKALRYQKDWFVRSEAASCLGNLMDKLATEPLILALSDKEKKVQESAAQALGKIGDPKAVAPLFDMIRNISGYHYEKPAQAILEIGPSAFDALLIGLKDVDWRIRATAARALGKIGDPKAVQLLISALMDKRDIVPRIEAANALGQIGDILAVEVLIGTLDEQGRVGRLRKAAAVALGCIGDERAIFPLIAALSDNEVDVATAAGSALSCFGTVAIEPLVAALKGRQGANRYIGLKALCQFGQPAVPHLLNFLNNPISLSANIAAEGLQKIGHQPNDLQVRAAYYIALGQPERCTEIGHPAVEPLISALASFDQKIKRSVVKVLGEIGDSQSIEALINLLDERDLNLRYNVAKALEAIGEEAVNPLMNALQASNWYIRELAARTLGQIGDIRAINALSDLLQDDEYIVRKAAEEAIDKLSCEGKEEHH
ncbi:MAG: HEAT repeat domain-containing protein [Anaerolineales bacterium]